jgi:flagellar basal-body rod modification protein FlgD
VDISTLGLGGAPTTTPSQSGSSAAGATNQLGQNAFLQLLIAQLQNQDPLQPMDNTQMVAQLAQFQTLQSQTQMTNSLNALVEMDQLGQAAGLIGKTIQTAGSNGANGVSGVVTAAGLQNGVAVLTVGSRTVNLSDVIQVTAGPAASSGQSGSGSAGGQSSSAAA